jgi:hypothetical protein
MNLLQLIVGYSLMSIIAPLVGYLCGKHGAAELGVTLAGGIAGLGGVLLHRQAPPGTIAVPKNAGLLVLLLALPLLHGCALFQKPAAQRTIACTADVLSACQANVLPTVAACLNAPANPTPCLLALLGDAGCATKEALVCRAKQAAEPAVIMTLIEPTDAERFASERRKLNAERFYADVGMRPAP